VPEMSNSFMFYIALVWIMSPLHFSLLPLV
jgi:hypothetical protein